MDKKKKIVIIICSAVVALAAIIGAVVFILINNNNKKSADSLDFETVTVTQNEATTKEYGKDEFDIKENESGEQQVIKGDELNKPQIDIKVPTKKSQIGIVLDNTLKIDSIAELNGRFCVIVENISKKDIEYAKLTFSAGNNKTYCKIVGLMSGQRGILSCEDNLKYNKDEYYVNWQITDPVFYDEKPQMHSNKFEITENQGEITIKNKSFLRVNGPIYIVYQRTSDGMNICSEARRVKLDKLKMREEKTVKISGYNPDTCEIIFIDYGK